MTYTPRARVILSPLTDGPERRAQVVSKLDDVDAYVVRVSTGERLTVHAGQLRPNVNEKGA